MSTDGSFATACGLICNKDIIFICLLPPNVGNVSSSLISQSPSQERTLNCKVIPGPVLLLSAGLFAVQLRLRRFARVHSAPCTLGTGSG